MYVYLQELMLLSSCAGTVLNCPLANVKYYVVESTMLHTLSIAVHTCTYAAQMMGFI